MEIFFFFLPPICTNVLKRWKRMTGPSSQTILETQKEKNDMLAVTIGVSVSGDNRHLIYFTCPSLMEKQVTATQWTTPHQWSHHTKVERRRRAISPNVTLLL